MAELKIHRISVSYTKKITEQSKVSTSMDQTPLELAERAMWSFFDRQYPGENEVPETITVDGQTFSYAEIQEYSRNRSNR